ncbi:MAG: hypothetical protein AB4041_14260 [Microcystaceae cyanobacterium]
MIPIPIDQLFIFGKYLALVLVILVPTSPLIYLGISRWFGEPETKISFNPLLLALKLFFFLIVFMLFTYGLGITGEIGLRCELEPTLFCQRERLLMYGLFKQTQSLTSLNPLKEYKTFTVGEEADTQLILTDQGHNYLLSPAHSYSKLEQVKGEIYEVKSIDDAIKEIKTFKEGHLGNVIQYRDKVDFLGSLVTMIQVIIALPSLLVMWIFFRYSFGGKLSNDNQEFQ